MDNSLYDTLNLSESASLRQIKDAYRSLAKSAHPDAGGSEEAFEDLKMAYDVLSDPERRARYDRTGDVDVPQESSSGLLYAAAANMLSQILSQEDYRTVDVLGLMRYQVDENTKYFHGHQAKLLELKARMEGCVERFTVEGDENPLRGAILAQVATINDNLRQIEESLDFDVRMRAFLSGYRYRVDEPQYRHAPAIFASIVTGAF